MPHPLQSCASPSFYLGEIGGGRHASSLALKRIKGRSVQTRLTTAEGRRKRRRRKQDWTEEWIRQKRKTTRKRRAVTSWRSRYSPSHMSSLHMHVQGTADLWDRHWPLEHILSLSSLSSLSSLPPDNTQGAIHTLYTFFFYVRRSA